jgi:Mlc titration factor MtfA (ptsG expression regulator)
MSMLFDWFSGKSRQSQAMGESLWEQTLTRAPYTGHLDQARLSQLRELCEGFLRTKTINGAANFEVTPLMRAQIAIQACLPILNLGLSAYEDFVEIIVYPGEFLVQRSQIDEAGVVHESLDALAGEAIDQGPIVLSWADVEADGAHAGAGMGVGNVVIHEFIHKLDLLDGEADGVPPLAAAARKAWIQALETAYEDFCAQLNDIEAAIPVDIDPESTLADPWFAALAFDPYAAVDRAEFFAVSGETFFIDPERLARAYPDWYQRISAFLGQDPLKERQAD